MKVCETCLLDKTSHSFKKIQQNDIMCTFYTCPAEATKYNDCDGIINHYDIFEVE